MFFHTAPLTRDSRKFCNRSTPPPFFSFSFFFYPDFQESQSKWRRSLEWWCQTRIDMQGFHPKYTNFGDVFGDSIHVEMIYYLYSSFKFSLPKKLRLPNSTHHKLFHSIHEDMVGALLNFSKWHAITSTVCGPIVDFSNFTKDVNHWMELRIASSNNNCELQRLSFWISISKLRCTSYKRWKRRFSFSKIDFVLVHNVTCYIDSLLPYIHVNNTNSSISDVVWLP
jgi:hypothetical protein